MKKEVYVENSFSFKSMSSSFLFFKKRKAQITAFMIIGIIILFSVGIVLYTKAQLIERPEYIPESLVPVKDYVESCITDSLKIAVSQIGRTGGYLYYPREIESMPTSYLQLSPGSSLKLPYWYNGRELMSTSDLSFQISRFIKENSISCIDNFSLFSDEFDITLLDNMEPNIDIYDDKVVVNTNYPAKFKDRQKFDEYTISQYHSELDVPLGEAFKLSQKVIAEINRNNFLENNTLEMIHASQLPSIGADFDCTPKMWTIEGDIKPFMQAMIVANNNFYTFKKTRDPKTTGKYAKYYNAWYNIDLGLSRSTDAKIDVLYDPSWGMDLDVYPNRGGVVEPAQKTMPLAFCLNLYNHKYSFQYPVVLKTSVPYGKGESYIFSFATLVSVKDHKPSRNQRFTSFPNLDQVSINEVCMDGEKDVRMIAQDYATGQYLENASFTYYCGHVKCPIGETELPRSPDGKLVLGFDAGLDAELPRCFGGSLVARKKGYLDSWYHDYSVGEYTVSGSKVQYPLENPAILYMTRMNPLNLSVVIAEYGSSQLGVLHDVGSANLRSMKESESFIATITSKELNFDASYYHTPGQDPFYVVGDTYYDSFMFPVRDMTYQLDFKLFDDNNWVGGLTGEFTVSADDVDGAKKMTIYLVRNYDSDFNKQESVQKVYDLINAHNITYRPVFE